MLRKGKFSAEADVVTAWKEVMTDKYYYTVAKTYNLYSFLPSSEQDIRQSLL